MPTQIRVSPVNSLLFMSDVNDGTPPEPVWGAKIQSTPSCISFACFPEQDGPTEIVIGRKADIKPQARLVFEGNLETPNRIVLLATAEHERLLSVEVPGERTKVGLD